MKFFLLQVVADSLQKAGESAAGTGKELSMLDLLMKGGWIMIPLLLLSLIAVYVFVERWMAIKKASQIDENFMNIIRDHIVTGNVTAARSLAKNTNNPVARIIDKGLQRIGKPIEAIEKSMENVGKLEVYKLEKNTGALSVISGIAPMFGFLGTIVGMVQLFMKINITNEYNLAIISGGIYTKMVTSAVGLIIGLMAYVAYNYLNSQINKTVNKMESASAEFIDTLYQPTH
ncbi:MAG: MotA/TolQ/ExbB proton channel family protein [Sphingobacteriales bacterium]|nr:MotA/TolQ/ExbB proton channel family protein [Sphingobacteriales bacterium]MBI3718738.1 MotA/TolQ/ExbB proton channel family protein [Sphingobacteriales bacterium]